MNPIRLAIADDQLLFIKGLKLLISSFEDIQLIIEAHNGQELLDAIAKQQPEVVLMDLRMPVMDGLEATKRIKAQYPKIKILLLSMYDNERLINHMMKVGANGYLLKNEDPEVLKEAIYAVMEKEFYFTEYVSKALLQGTQKKNKEIRPWKTDRGLNITKRELEILQLICQEYTSHEIAEKLAISKRTVENHRQNIIEKTGVKNTAGLIIFALRNRLVTIEGF